MKRFLCFWLFLPACLNVSAQASSEVFTYDREQVSALMDQIMVESVTSQENQLKLENMALTIKPFWKGFASGCLGGVAGVFAGYLGGEVMQLGAGFGFAAIISGVVLGGVIPQIVLSVRDAEKRDRWRTFQGTLASVGSGVLIVVIFEMVEVLSSSM